MKYVIYSTKDNHIVDTAVGERQAHNRSWWRIGVKVVTLHEYNRYVIGV